MGTVKRVVVVTSTGDYQRLKEPVGLTTPMLSDNGTKPVWIEAGGGGGSSAAEDVSVADAGNFFSGTDVEAVLQELAGGGPIDHGTLAGLGDDDHPQYADQTEFDDHHARHEAGGADEIDATGLVGAGSGITDHGDLTGLADDDHPQYTTDAEATTIAVTEAGAAVSDHAAVPTAHHTNANDPSAGEKAALAGTSGTPGSGNKYVTDGDARNTNARTPSAHAASHNAGGSDVLAIDAAAATGSLRTLGTGAAQAAAGNDARLTDSRAPSGAAGGELAGTYPNPTVAATHSGSAHHAQSHAQSDHTTGRVYVQSAQPSEVAGVTWIWIDTDDGRMYYSDGA